MNFFVNQHSIVRKIWGQSDTILFIFAGAAAEFALNKAVDWLYYTGRLPNDPLGRLFSTVDYARQIVFSENETALKCIDKISSIHGGVEKNRGLSIPNQAYQDVLYMLIDYSIRSYELLERKLNTKEKEEVFNVFYRVGGRMGIKDLPLSYKAWVEARMHNMSDNLAKSFLTQDLFSQYKKQLGVVRYMLLLEAQILIVPAKVREFLEIRSYSLLRPAVAPYKIAKKFNMDSFIKNMLLPGKYKAQIRQFDQ